MEAHGGRVGVHSDGEGRGTTFFFELPVHGCSRAIPSNDYGLGDENASTTTECVSLCTSTSSSSKCDADSVEDDASHASVSYDSHSGRDSMTQSSEMVEAMEGNHVHMLEDYQAEPVEEQGEFLDLDDSHLAATVQHLAFTVPQVCSGTSGLEFLRSTESTQPSQIKRDGVSDHPHDPMEFYERLGMVRHCQEPSLPATCRTTSFAYRYVNKKLSKSIRNTNMLDDGSCVARISILLADDSQLARVLFQKVLLFLRDAIYQTTLSDYEFDIQHARTGKEAYEMVLKSLQNNSSDVSYDLVLIDYYMPVLDGAEAACLMRAAGFQNAIIAATSCNSEGELNKLWRSGIDIILEKLFTIKKFAKLFLKHVIGMSEAIASAT